MSNYHYLSIADLIDINRYALVHTGQQFAGVQYPAGLEIVTQQPQQIVFGHELYPNIWLKAAFILQKLTKKHIFVDGNKRTAYLATCIFLRANNYQLRLTTKVAEILVYQITLARDTEAEMQAVARVLKGNTIKLKSS